MTILKKLGFLLILTALTVTLAGQGVTSSSISGRVSGSDGTPLEGATVVAIHEPSGSQFGTITRNDGGFNLPNVQTGGPFTIRVSFVGYTSEELSDIQLALGEDRNFSIILGEENVALEEVVVIGNDRVFSSGRTGTTTNISAREVAAIPNISRSINDLTRLSPQSNGSSFAGRDNRFNNYSIDGIIYNNNFGLGENQFAGGNPLSLEAIEEVQVNLAPYDVRQGGFSGANVNAITKRGTNIIKASAYTYLRNENMTGNKIGDQELNVADAQTNIYGASIGMPIIKDKLFFFFSAEKETESNPGLQKVASRPGLEPDGVNVSRVPADQLEFVRDQIANLYGYQTGSYENYDFASEAMRLNARIDYNINSKNKAMVRVNHYTAFTDVPVNENSIRYNPSVLRYRNTNRADITAMNFRNSHYSIDNTVTSVVGELNTMFNSQMANNFRIGYNHVEDPIRGIPGEQAFPFIEILEFEDGTPLYYMTLGNELYSVGNELSNNIFNITDNFTYYAGRHNLTFGLNFEYQTFVNAFNPAINGVYRYNSYNNFVASVIDRDPNVLPDLFIQGYSYEGQNDIPVDETKFAQFGLYAQDKFEVNPQLNLTFGLRIDLPFYPLNLPENPVLDTMNLEFTNPLNDEVIAPDVSVLPKASPLLSPRFGFNYDVFGDKTLQIRGGSGMFTGRIPFVWISNQVSNNGVTRGGFSKTPTQWEPGEWQGFQDDVSFYRPDPDSLEAQVSSSLAITDKSFKLPQVWRSNLAFDYALPMNIIATVEGIYSKDINSPLAVNINNKESATRLDGPYPFPYWADNTEYYNDSRFTDVILLTNTNEGHYASVTVQLAKEFGRFATASIAYTRSEAKDYGLEGGSQAASLWPFTVVDSRNDPEVGYSRFDKPNRLIGFLNINTHALNDHLNTSISLFYEGGDNGRFSYAYSGSFGDGADRLIYIPETAADAFLVDKTDLTAEQQWDILNSYIDQDKYLSKHRGEVAERNGAKLPWLNRFDLRVAQDFMVRAGNNSYKVQLHLDILNVGNLINDEWGVGETFYQRNLLQFQGLDADGNGTFTLNNISGTEDYPVKSYRSIVDLTQTWSAQVGIRLMFN